MDHPLEIIDVYFTNLVFDIIILFGINTYPGLRIFYFYQYNMFYFDSYIPRYKFYPLPAIPRCSIAIRYITVSLNIYTYIMMCHHIIIIIHSPRVFSY